MCMPVCLCVCLRTSAGENGHEKRVFVLYATGDTGDFELPKDSGN